MEPQDITPGFLTASAVKSLRSLMEAVRYNTQRLDQLTGQSEIDVPAKLTAYDSETGAYSWVEQWYDSDGNREDYDGGRSGGPDYMPAYAVGNGVAPEDWEFPIEVRLRPRINTSLGVVYEFPWNCSCNDGGSASGSIPGSNSGSVYYITCGGIDTPSVLYATFGSDFSSIGTIEITYYPDIGRWKSGYLTGPCGSTVSIELFCNGNPDPDFTLYLNNTLGETTSNVFTGYDTATGNPFYSEFNGTGINLTVFGCTSVSFSVTITEDMP